jgi:hypothetical protein
VIIADKIKLEMFRQFRLHLCERYGVVSPDQLPRGPREDYERAKRKTAQETGRACMASPGAAFCVSASRLRGSLAGELFKFFFMDQTAASDAGRAQFPFTNQVVEFSF